MKITKKLSIAVASLAVVIAGLVALNIGGINSQAASSYRNCNDDAILRCGALSQSELLRKYDQNVGDVKHIYNYYGIYRGDIAGTTSEVRTGTVYQDGRVVVDGKTVATGAHSVSRVRFTSAGIPKNVTINGTTYYEGPSMRIFVRPVDAFVMFRNGQFHKAVLISCGNPLIAVPVTPKPKPVYACDNLKADKIDRVRYRFDASATAKNGAEIKSYNFNFGDGNSKTSDSSTIEHTYAKAGTYHATVTVNFTVNGKTVTRGGEDCKVTVEIEEKPEVPVYSCDSLEADKISRTTFRFTTDTTAENGAKAIQYDYNFGDGGKTTTDQAVIDHTYAEPGTYNISVDVTFKVNDEDVLISSQHCKTTVTVEEKPEVPVYACDNLEAHLIQDKKRTYAYTLTYTAEGGAELDRVDYDFGDGNNKTYLKTELDSVEHTYAEAGKYTTTATLYFNLPNDSEQVERTKTCQVSINIEKPTEYCDVPGKEHLKLPKDSPECAETPPELPKTGIDTFISGGLGLGSLSAAGYYWVGSRRNLLEKLLGR